MKTLLLSRLGPLLLISIAIPGLIRAQRPKPPYDPETKEGLLIQHIQQESDPIEKLHFMEQFVVQYPAHPAILWVFDQLQPAYIKEKAWDDAMRVGEKRVAAEPENLDAAKLGLRAAENKANADDISRWADCTWRVASAVEAKGGRGAADAGQTKLYAESTLYSVAEQTDDPAVRVGLLLALQDRNPKSPFVENIPSECVALYKKINQPEKALALAQQTLANDPDNIDMLMTVAEFYFGKEDGQEKVIPDALHMIDVLEKKQRPANLTDDDWEKKKSQLLGTAYYMGGVSSSFALQYSRADQMLRAAMPLIVGDANQEAAALYHLGLANYKLADKDPARAQAALGYWRRCATIQSKFQEQAAKNAEAVKSEFNLP